MTKDFFSKGMLMNHTAVIGMTGSGKTSTAKLMVEQIVADGGRVCILDPIKSDWWGLISSKSGKRAGLPFTILGGPHGHVALHQKSGTAVGELVATRKLPLSIIDMADFKMGGIQDFFNDFSEALFKKNKGVLHLVIEEAHEFAPKEKSNVAGESMTTYWMKRLASAARTKGIRLIVNTQRVQSLHNSVLASCRTAVIQQLQYHADQEPVLKWLKGSLKKDELAKLTEIENSLPYLEPGEGWIRSTVDKTLERVRFPRIQTYDNTATPEDDADRGDIKTVEVDVEKLRDIMGKAAEVIEADSPAALQKKIATLTADKAALERKLANPPIVEKPVADKAALDAAHQRGRDEMARSGLNAMKATVAEWETDIKAIRSAAASVEQAAKSSEALITKFKRAFDKTEKKLEKSGLPASTNGARPPVGSVVPARAALAAASPRNNTSPAASGDGSLTPGEKAILIAVVQYDGINRDQLSVLAGYKRSSRDTYIQRLISKGLVTTSGQRVVATDGAQAVLGDDYQLLPTGDDLQAYWRARLPEGEKKILDVLIAANGNAIDRDQLDEQTGYKRSSRDTYIQRLKARRLVDIEGGGVRASATLF